jgi:ATP-dependent DNA helicase RecQ
MARHPWYICALCRDRITDAEGYLLEFGNTSVSGGFAWRRAGEGRFQEAQGLAIMPTGGGKSLCFQLPALLRDGVTLVISPLIALMRDQVRALKAAGVEAGALTSGNTGEETDAVFAALSEGRLKLSTWRPNGSPPAARSTCCAAPAWA